VKRNRLVKLAALEKAQIFVHHAHCLLGLSCKRPYQRLYYEPDGIACIPGYQTLAQNHHLHDVTIESVLVKKAWERPVVTALAVKRTSDGGEPEVGEATFPGNRSDPCSPQPNCNFS
jgi:hypothetical protein